MQEFGLPYASDPVISKHLARFLTRSLQNVQASDKLGALVGSRAGGCRDLKERALSGLGSAQEHYIVALPGRGSGLVAGAQTATLARDEVERLVLDGFFPVCDARARPYRTQSGLHDWGLPYAADSAITRYLADFLRDRTRVDAVLFNGGSLHAAVLRQRVLDQIGLAHIGRVSAVSVAPPPCSSDVVRLPRSCLSRPSNGSTICFDHSHYLIVE